MKNKLSQKFNSIAEQKPLNSIQREGELKKNLIILTELKDFIHPLSTDEFQVLEASILKEGILDPIIVWIKKEGADLSYIIVDGHHRYGIAQLHNLDFNIVTKDFENLEAVKAFMLDKQLGRRNLTKEQLSYYRGLKYNKKVQEQKEKGERGINIAQVMAEQDKVSEKTIRNDGKFAELVEQSLSPKEKEELIAGKSKLKKKDLLTLTPSEAKEHPRKQQENVQEPISSERKLFISKDLKGKGKKLIKLFKDLDELSEVEVKALMEYAKEVSDWFYGK